MDDILSQLGGLLLGAVPTIIFMALVYGAYAVVVHRPLTAVLADRRKRTEGAVEKARADIAAAEARTAEYEQRLREARVALFRSQEARLHQAQQKRSAAVAEARAAARAQIAHARAAIEQDKQKARAGLEAESTALASEIMRIVLRPAVAGSGGQT